MSEYERNKGKLIPTGIDTEGFSQDDYDTYNENGFAVIDEEIFEVEWEVMGEVGGHTFREIVENPDGTINFHTYHYNGRAHWTEIIEEGLIQCTNTITTT